nr:peptidoglycan recognition family protein [Herbihabitans rhizosphaerae]
MPTAQAAEPGRQQDFADAAREFGVPESVLLGVSYLESRWNTNAGTPSTSAGYGPMHLTDVATATAGSHHDHGSEDPRGDSARPTLRPTAHGHDTGSDNSSPSLRTVDLAATLTGDSPATLRSDARRNIRGGAAILAQYQRELGIASGNPADWYGAIARYAGATDTASANAFAGEVFATMRQGMERVTDDGQHVLLRPTRDLAPNTAQLGRLGLRQTARAEVECPSDIACEWIPAPYQKIGDGPGDYGNHDKANRPADQKIEYIIIHDTEGAWDGVLKMVQDPKYVSWHYTLRSADGHIAQHVPTKDVAWHAGNWYVNAKSIGLEHEGFAAQGTWYTEAMYRTSSKLVRHLAEKYRIPLDRQHILGHDNVPGVTPDKVKGMHWDPGPYWDWAHYFDLLGAPLKGRGNAKAGLVTIKPNFANNTPAFTGCDKDNPGAPCPKRGSTSVVLHTEPRQDAPLLADIGLRPDGSPSTMHVSDHGSRVETGQRYAVAEVAGDWTAVWYLGQKGWFFNPPGAPTGVWAKGAVVTPKPGLANVPVFGRAYPEKEAYPTGYPPQDIVPLQYSLPAGQRYAVGLDLGSEYYSATTFDPAAHKVIAGKTRYIQVQFGHRVAYVKADDVQVLPSGR